MQQILDFIFYNYLVPLYWQGRGKNNRGCLFNHLPNRHKPSLYHDNLLCSTGVCIRLFVMCTVKKKPNIIYRFSACFKLSLYKVAASRPRAFIFMWVVKRTSSFYYLKIKNGCLLHGSCLLCFQRELQFSSPVLTEEWRSYPSGFTNISCTWSQHERLKGLQAQWGRETCVRGKPCLVSTSKSLQLSKRAVSIIVRHSWQGQLICYAVCALFRQTHGMCQG